MPLDFKYKEVLERGRPRHEKWDNFLLKHPPLPPGKWAKIFSPFDTLDGFDERIAEKEVQYLPQAELCEDDQAELNRRLETLHNYTWNTRMAKHNHVMVSVTYFVPCQDLNHSAFGHMGTYKTISGMAAGVEMDALRLQTEHGETKLPFDVIQKITGAVFESSA